MPNSLLEFVYAKFLFLVIPDATMPNSIIPYYSFPLNLIPDSNNQVMSNSDLPVSIIALYTFCDIHDAAISISIILIFNFPNYT